MTDKDKNFNASDEAQVSQRKRKDERIRDIELADVKHLMSSREGRRFIWRMLDRTGVYRTSFTGNSTTFFNEGMRNIGLLLMADINEACADMYVQMMMEAKLERVEK